MDGRCKEPKGAWLRAQTGWLDAVRALRRPVVKLVSRKCTLFYFSIGSVCGKFVSMLTHSVRLAEHRLKFFIGIDLVCVKCSVLTQSAKKPFRH